MAFEWANAASHTFMSRGYLAEGETIEQRSWDIAMTAETILEMPGFAKTFFHFLGQGFYSLSSPVWSNFGRAGLPISCNGTYVGDSIAEMMDAHSEVAAMTKHGAGTSGFFGDIRPRGTRINAGGQADGPVHFMHLFETLIDIISQGNVRRGNFAAYLPVEHPDIGEFLELREEGSAIQKLSLGVCITDAWMQAMVDGDADKRKIWARIIQKRYETGFPYVFFTDNANGHESTPSWYQGLIKASNLCTEIMEPQNEDESFVCCLASMNLAKFDEWQGTDAVRFMIYFLDAVMSEYIEKTAEIPHMARPRNFAIRHRALGLGSLGYHTALQQKMIPFESFGAKLLNNLMHKTIWDQARAASTDLAEIYGACEVAPGMRNATLCAIAPTTSSSFILGQVSPSIEPLYSNYFTKNLAKGKFTWQNPVLDDVLWSYAEDFVRWFDDLSDHENETLQDNWVTEQWDSILKHGGSVQHLNYLTDEERAVFKTFGEISQLEIVQQAAARQHYIDQGQSINLMVHPKTPAKQVSELMIEAWKLGLKSLYYQRSTNPAQELVRDILTCSSCEA